MLLSMPTKRTWTTVAFALAAAICASTTARADQVTLKNGDRLTGRITRRSTTDLDMTTDLAGRVTIRMDAVSQVVPAAPAAASTASPSWHGALNADVDVNRGNSETRAVSTNGTSTRLGPRDRLGVFASHLSSAIGSGADSVTTARSTRGGIRYDHDVLGRLFGFGSFDAENDALQLLDLRTVAGAGLGAHLLKNSATQFNLFAGASYARDSYTDVSTTTTTTTTTTTPSAGGPVTTPGQGGTPPGQGGTPPGQARAQAARGGTPPAVVRTSLSRQVAEFLVGEDLTRQLSDRVSLSEGLTFFPAATDVTDYRVSFDFSLWAQLNDWLQWHATVSDRYLHIPPAGGAVQNDTFIATGLGITFGHGDGGAYTGSDGRRPPAR
jgi:putative salt-induced outer membrane protein YdiY